MTCQPDCPCKNPDAPKYPSGKMFNDQRGRALLVTGKEGRFPDARYRVLDIRSGNSAEYSYPALVRKEKGR